MENYLGEIRLFAGDKVPEGWQACDGSLIPISSNEALFSLLQYTYGGTATEFCLPNLVARIPIGAGQAPGGGTYPLGVPGGSKEVTLTAADLPGHTHDFRVTTRAATKFALDENLPATVLAAPDTANDLLYIRPGIANTTKAVLAAESISSEGGGKPHANVMPSFALRYIIALTGQFPDFS